MQPYGQALVEKNWIPRRALPLWRMPSAVMRLPLHLADWQQQFPWSSVINPSNMV